MKVRPSDLAEYALVAVSAAVGASLAAGIPFVGVPIAGMALGWLAFRHGYVASVLVALAAAAAGSVLGAGWQTFAFAAPALLAAGPGSAWALRRWQVPGTVALLAVVLVGAAVLSQTVVGVQAGRSFIAQQRADTTEAGSLIIAAGKAAGIRDMAALERIAKESVRQSFLLWPTAFAYLYGLAAVIAVPLVSRMARTLDAPVSRTPRLADLDLSLHVVWPAIAGLGLLAAATYLRQSSGLVWAAGANMLLIARAPLFVQGLGDFAALYRRGKVGRVGRTFGFTLLAVSEVVIPSVSVVGLVDLFANLRRLPRRGSGGKAGLEGGPGTV